MKKIDWSRFTGKKAPVFAKDLFQYITDYKAITLIVPEATYEWFTAHADWSKLNIVKATTTGLSTLQPSTTAYAGKVYDLQGRYLTTVANESELNRLPVGMYICNGKKVLVK